MEDAAIYRLVFIRFLQSWFKQQDKRYTARFINSQIW